MSLGPNFVFLGGQKYGFRPIPTTIEVDEYNLVKKTLKDLGRDITDFSLNVPHKRILVICSCYGKCYLNFEVAQNLT